MPLTVMLPVTRPAAVPVSKSAVVVTPSTSQTDWLAEGKSAEDEYESGSGFWALLAEMVPWKEPAG